jgi:hypothetical protein
MKRHLRSTMLAVFPLLARCEILWFDALIARRKME